MGILTIKEEFLGLLKAILVIIAFLFGAVGVIATAKLIKGIFQTLSDHGIIKGTHLLTEDITLIILLSSIGIIGIGINRLVMRFLKRISIPPARNNLPQSIPYVTYGKWIKVAIVPKNKR